MNKVGSINSKIQEINSNQSNQSIKTADQTSASPYSFAVFFSEGLKKEKPNLPY